MGCQERIVRNPQIVGGEPVFMETRVTLKTGLLSLAEGAANAEILADFPTLSEEDVRAAIAVAGASTPDNTCSDVKGSVKAGRLVVDEPTDLPEGTEVELLPIDPGDWLDDDDRAALQKALFESEQDGEAGRLIDADTVLRGLRSRRNVR